MAPPTIANGKVYLASFGTENTGTGQLCVYGQLPNGTGPEAPQSVYAAIQGRFVSVEWSAVPGATTYTVLSRQSGPPRVVASGLTKPAFTEPSAAKGTTEYTIVAVNADGQSIPSAPATVSVEQVPGPRMAH